MNNPHFCTRHNCAHKWLLTSSYCEKCEQEKLPTYDQVQETLDIFNRLEEVEENASWDEEHVKDAPIVTWTPSIRAQWEAKYGTFIRLELHPTAHAYYPITVGGNMQGRLNAWTADFLEAAGYPTPIVTHCLDEWHDSIAKVWPI